MSIRNQLLSYLITFVVYICLMPWQTALMVMLGIAWHEKSHGLAAKKVGLTDRGFLLIPALGGINIISGEYKKYTDRIFVVIAGPAGGGFLAFIIAGLYFVTGNVFIGSAALWMTYINLFNLLPLSFMDGGQIAECITYSIGETVGFVAMTISYIVAIPILWHFSPIFSVVITFAGYSQVIANYKNWKTYQLIKEFGGTIQRPKLMNTKEIVITIVSVCFLSALLGSLIMILQHQGLSIFGMFN
jgi:Zn-dependent protease